MIGGERWLAAAGPPAQLSFLAILADPFSRNPDPDPGFFMNTDPDPD
jgi:hypothetical protein